MACESGKITQIVPLLKDGRKEDALTPRLEVSVDKHNGFIRVIESTGFMAYRFAHPVEVSHLCENRWLIMSKGHEAIVIEKTEYGWMTCPFKDMKVSE